MKIVLQKFIADSGYCSRRQAEKLIRGGAVKFNGKIASLGERADGNDAVLVNNRKMTGQIGKIYIKLNKPPGYICTTRKFKNEKNVFDLVNVPERLFLVGRLDKESHGLVLLTNDGALAQKMTHPRFEIGKSYLVKAVDRQDKNGIGDNEIKIITGRFKNGIEIGEGDGLARAEDIKYAGDGVFNVILKMGKKRQIRRMFGALGYEVVDLQRIALGKLSLGGLKDGEWRYLKPEEIKELKK